MITLQKYPTEIEAEVDRAVLEANGIRALVVRDNAGGMLPSLNLLASVRLVVDDADVDDARKVLEGE
ncbi:MAG: putative signal transducing protein [Gemmatimonadales bacterium]